MKDKPSIAHQQDLVVLDAAFGQEIITVNEFRQLLGLERVTGGDVTVKGRSLEQAWKEKAKP
jgi:hypothetical protein